MQRQRSDSLPMRVLATAVLAMAIGTAQWISAQTAPSATLERVRAAGTIKIGYRPDAMPFSFADASGRPTGYSLALCAYVTDAVKAQLQLPALKVETVAVTAQDRFDALQRGTIDILCGADTVSVGRRTQVSFSLPIFPGGIGALLRADAPIALRDVLSGKGQPAHPVWRASASRVLRAKDFAAVTGTTAATWLPRRIDELQILTNAVPAASYDAGVQAVIDRTVDALFGERAILLGIARKRGDQRDLQVVDRLFTYEPLALALRTNDEPLRLLVDQTLARLYATGAVTKLYASWFGTPDETANSFFRWIAVPE
jgi:ABC-type amino acid transport substrate-binding protein